jgi:hypothetical protein
MATANPSVQHRRPRRRLLWLLAAIVAVLLVVFWVPLNAYAVTGASFGARLGCSCRYIGGRELGDCRKDFEPGMELVTLTEDAEARSVTARFLILSSQTATFREGQGCLLEPWDG